MENYREAFAYWKSDPFFDEATRAELAALTDEREIEDRFTATWRSARAACAA